MEYTVTGEYKKIDFAASGKEEILQNVRSILTTFKGTVPLDREFGIESDPVDAPIEIAKARLSGKIIDAIREFEPRVEVSHVLFEEDDLEGKLIPIVQIRLREGEAI